MKSLAFTLERLLAVSTVQQGYGALTPPWVWSQKTALQWSNEVALYDQSRIAEITKRAEWRAAAATWDLTLAQIQRVTRDVKREGLYAFRDDKAVARRFRSLHTDARRREGLYTQGETARAVWAKADAAWTYEADFDVAAFGSLLAGALARKTTHANAYEDWRVAASKLMALATACHRDCVAWYAAATRKFKAGTAEGDTLRSTVPTTYRPPPPVGQAVFSNILVSGGTIHFDCAALRATRFTYLHMPPGVPVFTVLFADSPEKSVTLTGQPAGLHRFQAIPRNSGGEGQASEVAEITAAQPQAA